MTVIHTHHLTPTHAGGSDTDDNKVQVPIVRHAMFHFARWQLYGDPYDRLAWRGLAGLATHEECAAEAMRLGSANARKQRSLNNPNWHEKVQKAGTAASTKKFHNDPEYRDRVCKQLRQNGFEFGHLGGQAGKGKAWWYNSETGEVTKAKNKPGPDWINGKAPLSAESKARQSAAQKGKVCWNNGEITVKSKECPGDGWQRGRLPHKKRRK